MLLELTLKLLLARIGENLRILVDFFVLTRGAVCDEARHDHGDHEEDATRLHFSQLTDPSTWSLILQVLQRSLSRG